MNKFPPLPEPHHRGPPETGDYFSAFTAQQMRDYVEADRALRQAVQEPAQVPEGLVLVPIEPTNVMRSAGRSWSENADEVYSAMIATAPDYLT